ncbi:MAG: SRPBCC family protein [Candidatus Alcyoniella australis]|nr:SRPBCC family protein [Candidatus Alcyoniella australis]
MNRFCILLLIAALLLPLTAIAAQPPLPELSNEELATLRSGEPLLRDEVYADPNGNSCGSGYALIKVDASPDEVWKQILDYNHYADFFPNVDEAVLYRQEGELYFTRFTLSVIAVVKVTYHCKHTLHREDGWLEWRLDDTKPNDFKKTDGRWVVWPFENGSLLSYAVFVDSGRDVPKFIQNMASKWGLKQVVLSVKRRVESGGRYTR